MKLLLVSIGLIAAKICVFALILLKDDKEIS
jgi:hypothetical protein